ncbi:MAG: TonB-dependent receptor, partial [Novosphingobium sp.]
MKSVLRAGVAIVIAGTCPEIAFAQQAAESPSGPIVVTGYQESLSVARAIKKEAVIQKDVIVAEDMAKFPELNLAESLQRLPGIQITREAGEGRRISLRGLGPDFARVQLNGMEVLGNVDSAQDSRGQRSRDRAFDFNIFASELFSKVEVEKTFQAAQNEGGMAGTVGLFTGKPFDYGPGSKGAISAKLGTNQYTKDAQPRIAAMYSHNWGNTFGVTLSVAYSRRKTTEQGHNTYNYTKISGSRMAKLVTDGLDISGLSADTQAALTNPATTFYFADGNRISSWNARMERLGMTAAVQWRPADNLLLTFDALHGEFTTHRDELHLATRPIPAPGSVAFDVAAGDPWPALLQTPSTINDIAWDSSNYITRIDVTNATLGSEHRRELNKNRFNQAVLTFQWDASDVFSVDGHAGYEKSTYKTPYDDKFYIRAKGNLIADYGADGRSASITYPGWDTTDPANYTMDDFYYRSFHNGSELQEGVLNLHYKASGVWTIRAGAAYHRFSQNGASYYYDGDVNGTRPKTRGTSVADITDVFTNSFGSWLIGNYDRGLAKYNEYHRLKQNADGSGGVIEDIENVFDVTEKTWSGYVQADWDSELAGMRFRGNVGLRGYSTDTRSTGWIQGHDYAYLGTTDVKGSYSGVLPAMNAVLEVTPDALVRFAATQNLNRPSLGSMAAQGSAFANADPCVVDAGGKNECDISVSRGNPNLKP